METYSIIPIDIMETMDNPTIMNGCGSYPYFTKAMVVAKIKELKKQFPMVKLGLYKGETWGSLELVKEF